MADGATPRLCHRPAEIPPWRRGSQPLLWLRWERSLWSRLWAPLPPRCLPSGCRGEPAACRSWRAPAWPGGVTEEGSDPLGAPGVLAPVWDSTGDKCPCRTIPSETGWTMLVGPGSPGRWHGSSRQHLSGTGHSSLSDSAAASSSLAPAAPDGKAVPGRLHPMTPRASPVIHPSHPKSSSTQGLTGQAGPRS